MSTEEIENYFVESAGYGRDKVRNFMDIVNKALKQKGERITELQAQIEKMKCCGNCKYYQFQNDPRYYTCIKDGKRNGKYYRSCEFNLEKWEGR